MRIVFEMHFQDLHTKKAVKLVATSPVMDDQAPDIQKEMYGWVNLIQSTHKVPDGCGWMVRRREIQNETEGKQDEAARDV